MSRETKQTLMTGLALFVAGVVSLFLLKNDDGLFGYILLAYGAWEIGEVISDVFFTGEGKEEGDRCWKEILIQTKKEIIKITIPMILSMIVEVVMIGTGFRLYTLVAYLVTLLIYLLFIGVSAFVEYKRNHHGYILFKEEH